MDTLVLIILNALLIIVPLIFSTRSSELFEFPKLITIYMGAGMLLPLVVFKIYKQIENQRNPERSRGITDKNGQRSTNSGLKQYWFLFVAVTLFFVSQLLSTYFSIDTQTSIFGYYSRFNGGLLSLVSYIIIFLAAVLFVKKEQLRLLLNSLLIGGTIAAVWGLPSHFGHDFICFLAQGSFSVSCWTAEFYPPARMFSTLGQPNWFSTYLLVLIFVTLYFIVMGYKILNKKSEQTNRYILLILFILFSVDNLWTNSRSGMISYIVLVPLFFIGAFMTKKIRSSKLAQRVGFFALGAYTVVAGLFALPFIGKFAGTLLPHTPAKTATQTTAAPTTPTEPLNITSSSQIRKTVWAGALQLGLKYPMFGTGVETFAYAYNFTRPAEHNMYSEWEFVYNKAHNEVLNYFATTGFIGVGTYLLMFLAFLSPAVVYLLFFRNPPSSTSESNFEFRIFSLTYICSMLAIFGMNLVGFSTTMTNLMFYMLPALYLVLVTDQSRSAEQLTTDNKDNSFLPTTPFILFIFYVVGLGFYMASYVAADYYFARSKELKQANDMTGAYQMNQKAIDIRQEPTYLDQQAFISANIAAALKMQKDEKNANTLAKEAIALNTATLNESPLNVFYLKTSAKVYHILAVSFIDDKARSTAYMNSAISSLYQAMKLAPTDVKLPYTLAAMMIDEKPQESKKLLEQAIKLKPDYQPAHDLLKKITL